MIRSSRFLPLLAVVALLLAACGPNTESPDETEDDGGGAPTTAEPAGSPGATDGTAGGLEASGEIFVFGFSYDSTDDVVARTRVEHTQEQYPDLDVSFSESGFDSAQFLTAVQSDDPPDVVRISRDIIGSYISRGVLAPLDDCVSNSGIDTSIYRPAAIEQLTSEGTLYGLPDFFDTTVWMASTAEFEEDGVDLESMDWSDWDAIAEANEQLKTGEGGDLEEIGIDPKIAGDYSHFSLWVYANGGQLLSDDGMESLLDTPEVIEALEFTKGLIDAHGGVTPFLDFRGNPDANGDFFGAPNQFDLGTEAAFPQQQWYLNVLSENSPDLDLTVTPFQTTEGEPITFQEGSGWAIVEGTDNPDGACAFITSMTETDAWVAAAETRAAQREEEGLPFTGVYSGNSEADEIIFGELVDLSDFPVFDEAVQAVLEAQENAYAVPASPAGEQFRQIVLDYVDQALTGQMTPEEAMLAADEEAQAEIDAAASGAP